MLPLLTLKGNDNALPFVALATMGDGGIALLPGKCGQCWAMVWGAAAT